MTFCKDDEPALRLMLAAMLMSANASYEGLIENPDQSEQIKRAFEVADQMIAKAKKEMKHDPQPKHRD